MQDHQVSCMILGDLNYPKLLKEISEPPYLLYVQWTIEESPYFSVIGSRKISSYGERSISKIVADITPYFTIVSWWAYGCDTKAHEIALENNTKTIIVVGTGIDIVYPAINRKLHKRVLGNGWAILSIFPFEEPGNRYNFPMRNEVISWLSLGTLVVEAAERSGTLITANMTLEQGRDLFVIPWEIDKNNSAGCNKLLRNGEAKIVTSAQDILEEYNFLLQKEKTSNHEIKDPLHKSICDFLSYEALSWDEIAHKMNTLIHKIIPAITLLEMKKILRKNKEWKYELC